MITKRPMQRDLFTGNLIATRPKAGRGGHVLLKAGPDEKYPVPGMAHFAGTGPAGKRCQHCTHCQDIPVWGRDRPTPALAWRKDDEPCRRVEHNACRKACELYDNHVQRGGINFESACKYFEPREN